MGTNGRHIGFLEEVPEEVYWSELSWVVPVPPSDRRDCRGVQIFAVVLFFLLFVLSVIIFQVGMKLASRYGFSQMLPIVISGVLIPIGLGFGIFSSYLVKGALVRRLRSRSDLLFEPGRESIFVGIENAFTFDKQKLTADDFGLLRITPGLIQLEMTKHRAQFLLEDVAVTVVHANKNSVGVRLTSRSEPFLWSVVLSPAAMSRNIFAEGKGEKKAQRLLKLLKEAGASAARPSAAASSVNDAESVAPDDEMPTAISVTEEETVENADLLESRYQTIVEAIRNKEKSRRKPLKSILILGVSLAVFFQLGFVRWGLESALTILLVLVIHELGHYLGMKAFGYKNIQMFFIPLMGAAVSGTGRNVAAWKKALVTLMGPLPGIVIGLGLAVGCLISANMALMPYALMFLVLNLLNLLPIFPLDGGRFLHEVLFSRSRYLELTMNILATAALLIAGFSMGDWVLRILGFLNLFTLGHKFRMASAAVKMRADLLEKTPSLLENAVEGDVPESILKQMIHWIHHNTPGAVKPDTAATMSLDLWDRIRIRPPKAGATVGLMMLFLSGYVVSFFAFVFVAAAHWKDFRYESEIVSFADPNGVTRYAEHVYSNGELYSETELTEDQRYYHGAHFTYKSETPVIEGQWENGRKVGTWKHREPGSEMTGETLYEDGKPVLFRTLKDGHWEEEAWESLDDEFKAFYSEQAELRQGPLQLTTDD